MALLRVGAQGAHLHAGVGDTCVEPRGQQVDKNDDADGCLGGGVDAGVDERKVNRQQVRRRHGPDELPTQQNAENDGRNGQALDPAVGLDQLRRGQQLGQDAVFGGGVGGGTQPHNGIRQQRVGAKQHHQAAHHLDGIADEHHFALGHGVGKSPHQRGQHHIKHRKNRHQRGTFPLGTARYPDQLHRSDKKRVVSQ